LLSSTDGPGAVVPRPVCAGYREIGSESFFYIKFESMATVVIDEIHAWVRKKRVFVHQKSIFYI
jgi:hypothetical protein